MTETGSDRVTDTTSTARHEASEVADDARRAGHDVAETVKDEASRVTSEAAEQTKRLLGEARTELQRQASTQQHRAAEGIRTVGSELRQMANSSEEHGLAADVVGQVAARVTSAANWLDSREPGSIIDEVKSFARRRPGLFIVLALGAGVVAGRLAKALTDSGRQESAGGTSPDYDRFAATDFGSTPSAGYTPATDFPPPAMDATAADEPLYEQTYEETMGADGGDYPR